jgi:HD-like signal output (HDOD) protein
MSLCGEIQTMPLPDLFQWLAFNHKTGALALVHEQVAQKFYFSEGAIADALSTAAQAEKTEQGVRRILAETLRWTEGHFDFSEGALPREVSAANLQLDTQQLLLDTFRELDDTAEAPHMDGQANGSQEAACAATLAEGLRLVVLDRLLKGEFTVPLLPTVASKVMEVTQQENYSLRDLSNVILTDQVIAAQVLKFANSALFSGDRQVDSLPMAVQRLGSETVTSLVFSLSVQSMRSNRDSFLEAKQRIWEHASTCSLLSRLIATTVRLDHNLAFLCGLMMDFGKIALLSLIQEVQLKHSRYQSTPPEIITGIVEAYHSKVGGVVGEKWNLPSAVRASMKYHHALTSASEHGDYVAVANLSDALASSAARAVTPPANDQAGGSALNAADLAQLPAARLLGLSEAQIAPILERVPECVKYATELLTK